MSIRGDEYLDEAEQKYWQEDEQKPAEWNEDSVKFEEGFKAGRESGLRDGQKYVLNNLDSYGLCKPAEWSEEDEDFINMLILHFNYLIDKGGDTTPAAAVQARNKADAARAWRESNDGYLWIKRQVQKGRKQKDILREFNEFHEMGLAGFSTREGCAMNVCTLSRWIKEIKRQN